MSQNPPVFEVLPRDLSAYRQGNVGIDYVHRFESGKPGPPEIFANTFAGPNPPDRNSGKAAFRPSGIAVAPDGSMYVVDTVKGRLWHITYDGKN